MRRLQPVIWSKGTFLTPQHLQAQDRFIESVLDFRMQTQVFRPWGFHRLKIDQGALAAGTLNIMEASGLFPDGLAFEIPESDPAVPPRAFADQFDSDQQHLDLHLAIPPMREYGMNVSVNHQGADTRFRADLASLRDENTGTAEKSILVARKNFRLLTEHENREGISAMPLARVQRNSSDSFQLDPQFVPPVLSTGASSYLISIARRLTEILSAKSASLSGLRRQKNQSLADFTASDVANFWLLYTTNTYLPQIRHLFEVKHGHPEELFAVMLSMAGVLTTFSREIRPSDLPTYNHDDLGPCFTDLDEKVRKLLETVVPSNFIGLPLKEVRNSIYATAIADDKYLTNTHLYLAVAAETQESNIIRKVPQLVKVCSADHIDHLVRQALPGVPLTHVAVPPSAIPIKLNYQYFSLSQAGGAWEAIGRARNLAAYVPSDFPNPQLELIVVLPQAS